MPRMALTSAGDIPSGNSSPDHSINCIHCKLHLLVTNCCWTVLLQWWLDNGNSILVVKIKFPKVFSPSGSFWNRSEALARTFIKQLKTEKDTLLHVNISEYITYYKIFVWSVDNYGNLHNGPERHSVSDDFSYVICLFGIVFHFWFQLSSEIQLECCKNPILLTLWVTL